MSENTKDVILEARQVVKRYQMGKVTIEALKGIHLQIERGSFHALAGESGCGKTTTLHVLGGLMRATSGYVGLEGQDITKLNDRRLSAFRNRHIGFVFQDFNLIDVYTAFDNIAYPLQLAGVKARERKQRVMEMLAQVGMEPYARHKPNEMSGGQKQRVAIARALIGRPQLVLADEPTANLDSQNSELILQLLQKLNKNLGTTLIVATHSQQVMQYASKIWRMRDGLMVERQ